MDEKSKKFGETGYTNLMSLEDALRDTNIALESDKKGLGSDEFKVEGLPQTTCSGCQKNKVRLARKTPKKSTRKYYEDQEGRPWSGRSCPDCTRLKAKEHMRKKRAKPNPEII